MKIAFSSDNGSNISRHFGRSEFYVVVDLEEGKVQSRKLISKESTRMDGGHHYGHGHGHHYEHDQGQAPIAVQEQTTEFTPPEMLEHNDGKHKAIFEPIQDCQVVVSGGMGGGALQRLSNMKIETILTDMKNIDEAVQAYIAGTLEHKANLAH